MTYICSSLEPEGWVAEASRQSGLRNAVLGLVARGPSHPYGLFDQIRRWPFESAVIPERRAIYRAVAHLEQDGLIRSVSVDPGLGSDHLQRTTYGVTEKGIAQLREWLSSPPATYEDLCLRLVAHRREDVPLVIGFLREAEAACLARLEGLRMPEIEALVRRNVPWEYVGVVLAGTVEANEAAGRWKVLREMRRTLEDLQSLAASDPTSP
jgi:DNA-binding PadR family transcriptional regulator